jgi:hypothetical protein
MIDDNVPEDYQDAAHDAKNALDLARACKGLRPDKAVGAAKKFGRNPFGSKGKPDHQRKVDELQKKAEKEARPGEQVQRERKIKGQDSNRIPDVQIVDEHGRTRKVFEAERNSNRKGNRDREKEYGDIGVECETHSL